MIRIAALTVLLLAGCSQGEPRDVALPAKPLRIVSMNPCVDAILKETADPAQIAAISHYSQDPRATSAGMKWAMQFKAISGNAEEVIAAEPDLVISGPHVAIQTLAALKHMGIPIVQVSVPESIAQSREQIILLAKTVGRSEQAAILNAKIDAAVIRVKTVEGLAKSAIIWQGGGLIPGDGTLANELLTTAGYRNISAEYGLKRWDILPLEPMLASPPDTIFTSAGLDESDRMLSHPVMRAVAGESRIADYPRRLLHCGGPTIIAALDQLSIARRSERER